MIIHSSESLTQLCCCCCTSCPYWIKLWAACSCLYSVPVSCRAAPSSRAAPSGVCRLAAMTFSLLLQTRKHTFLFPSTWDVKGRQKQATFVYTLGWLNCRQISVLQGKFSCALPGSSPVLPLLHFYIYLFTYYVKGERSSAFSMVNFKFQHVKMSRFTSDNIITSTFTFSFSPWAGPNPKGGRGLSAQPRLERSPRSAFAVNLSDIVFPKPPTPTPNPAAVSSGLLPLISRVDMELRTLLPAVLCLSAACLQAACGAAPRRGPKVTEKVGAHADVCTLRYVALLQTCVRHKHARTHENACLWAMVGVGEMELIIHTQILPECAGKMLVRSPHARPAAHVSHRAFITHRCAHTKGRPQHGALKTTTKALIFPGRGCNPCT